MGPCSLCLCPSMEIFFTSEEVVADKKEEGIFLFGEVMSEVLLMLQLFAMAACDDTDYCIKIFAYGKGSDVLATKQTLHFIIRPQYIPCFIRIIPISSELKRTSGVFAESAWDGSVSYLLLHMLGSHIVIWFSIPAARAPRTDSNNNALALIVLFQYVPRLYLIFPLNAEIIKATGVVTKTAWAGAAHNLVLYMLEPQILLQFIWLEHLHSTQQTNLKHAPKILSSAVFPPRLSF